MAYRPPPSSHPPSSFTPPLSSPLQPSVSEPDLSRLRSAVPPLPPGAMPPVVVARSHSSGTLFPQRRISMSKRGRDGGKTGGGGMGNGNATGNGKEIGGSATSIGQASTHGNGTTNWNGNGTPMGMVGALLYRFPSLRRSASRSSSISTSPSPTPPALSPPPPAQPVVAPPPPPPSTSVISSPSTSAYHTPLSLPSTSPASSVPPLPLSSSPLSASPMSSSPPRPSEPRRSFSSPMTATTSNTTFHVPTPSTDDSATVGPAPPLSLEKRAQTMPLLPRTHTKRFYGLMELIVTERNYVRDLTLLVDVYLPALQAIAGPAYPTIVRNLPALRAAHVGFLQDLEDALILAGLPTAGGDLDEPLHVQMQLDYATDEEPQRISKAVGRISRAFFFSADVWNLYDDYCASHTPAMAALDKLSARLGSTEWRAWERKCMNASPSPSPSPGLSPLDVGSRPASPTFDMEGDRDREKEKERDRPVRKQPSLQDLFIEPVQRICRYPLLLAKLLPPDMHKASSTTLRTNGHVNGNGHSGGEVEHGLKELRAAYRVMREIVTRVDEARERRERELRGEKIALRIEGPSITETLVVSLGPPLLAGALDVLILPRNTTQAALFPSGSNGLFPTVSNAATITPMSFAAPAAFSTAPGIVGPSANTANLPSKVRYLGAFLYAGCLLLVKPKKSTLYEARHWLELGQCELVEPTPDDPPLLNCFCLSKDDKYFYFAASCAQEKTVWLSTLAQAIVQEHALGDHPLRSSPLLQTPEDDDLSPQLMQPPALLPQSASISNSSGSSSTSTPAALTLRRPTPQQRTTVDRCLADVFSDSCLAARAGAVLFPDSGNALPSGFSRLIRRDSPHLPAPPVDKDSSPATTPMKRKRLSVRSLTGLSTGESFNADDSVLTSVPESEGQAEGEVPPAHRRQRTYSYTMSSVRGALSVSRRPASVQNILSLHLHIQPSPSPSPDPRPQAAPPSAVTVARTASQRASSLFQSLSSRQRTRSAPVSASNSIPTSPTITQSLLQSRPPPVDTGRSSENTSPGSAPTSPIEFRASGRFRDRLESMNGSMEGCDSQEGVPSDTTDQEPSASEESAHSPPPPPEASHHVHVRSPSDDPGSLTLPAKQAMLDLTRLTPGDAKKASPAPSAVSPASTLRRKNTGSFFGRLNPFTPVVH